MYARILSRKEANMNNSSTGIKKRHAEFLRILHGRYGETILNVSMSEIAKVTKNNLQTAINYMNRLEKFGYVQIFRISTNKRRIEINNVAYNKLMQEVPTLYK